MEALLDREGGRPAGDRLAGRSARGGRGVLTGRWPRIARVLPRGGRIRAGWRPLERSVPGTRSSRSNGAPRHPLRVIRSAPPGGDRRTLTLLTAHPWRATYDLSVPAAGVETDYDLSGLEASGVRRGRDGGVEGLAIDDRRRSFTDPRLGGPTRSLNAQPMSARAAV